MNMNPLPVDTKKINGFSTNRLSSHPELKVKEDVCAKSDETKFQNPDILSTFDSYSHALSYIEQFCNHMEEKVQGSLPLKRHVEKTSPSKIL